MIPEAVTGGRRKPLEAELDDVQEIQRRRDNSGKRHRMSLRQAEGCRPPRWMEDYSVNATIKDGDMKTAMTEKWHSANMKVPKSFTEAMKTLQQDDWYNGMAKEVAAMFAKGVLTPIDETEGPKSASK